MARGLATPVEISVWPKEVGADFLIARTGHARERASAEALSETLGGLPLAHELAAAYCERLEVSLAAYLRRFEATTTRLLDDQRDFPASYHDGMTLAKAVALAIEEAGKLHSASEPLLVHAAHLAPEPIPLFLFAEAREAFGEPLASALAGDGLDETVTALRAFALVDRETIVDERDPTITTDTIRLHPVVRHVAQARRTGAARDDVQRDLLEALAAVYPEGVGNDPKTWPRARRLDALALALVGVDGAVPQGTEELASYLLGGLASFRHYALAVPAQARPLSERALTITENAFGSEHPQTAESLNNLGLLLQEQDDLATARSLFERALEIDEKTLGPDHPRTATSLNNLAVLLRHQGDLAAARPLIERSLAIREKALGADDPRTATSSNGLAGLLREQGDLLTARPLFERALAIDEKALGPEHPSTAISLNNLALLLQEQGDLAGGAAAL